MPLAETLGLRGRRRILEEVHLRLEHQERLRTAGGILHGGADGARGPGRCLLRVPQPPDGATGTATIESKTNFFLHGPRWARRGHAAHPLHSGRTTIVDETDSRMLVAKHVARVTQTQAVLTP